MINLSSGAGFSNHPQYIFVKKSDTIRMASWIIGDPARILSIVVVFFAGTPGDGPQELR